MKSSQVSMIAVAVMLVLHAAACAARAPLGRTH